MAISSNLGFPRIGRRRELKQLLEDYWSGASDADALERVRDAAEIARRSGVLVELSDDERRIFDAVVRKEQLPLNGSRDGEIQRLRKEVGRSEGMLTNENFVANAPPEVVEGEREKLARYRRELDALDG